MANRCHDVFSTLYAQVLICSLGLSRIILKSASLSERYMYMLLGGFSYFLSFSGYFGMCDVVWAIYEYVLIGIVVVYSIVERILRIRAILSNI